MPRRLRHYREEINRGINDSPEHIQPGEVSDSRNVWSPDGATQTRPGLTGIGFAGAFPGTINKAFNIATRISGVYAEYTTLNVDLGILAEGDAIYFSADDFHPYSSVLYLRFATPNTVEDFYLVPDYWDGSNWRPLHVAKPNSLWLTSGSYSFNPPADWSSTDVDGNLTDKPYIRCTVFGAAPTNNVTIDLVRILLGSATDRSGVGIVGAIMPSGTVYIGGYATDTISAPSTFSAHSGYPTTVDRIPSDGINSYTKVLGDSNDDKVPSLSSDLLLDAAILPEFNLVIVSFQQTLLYVDVKNKTIKVAETTTDPDLIGARARYDASTVFLSPSVPKAKYVSVYDGRIFCSGILGKEHTIQWSEPSEAYGVWPLVNQEPLIEADNSPITGQALLGEQLAVFKQDSIWLMALTGPDSNGFDHYVPRQVIAGKGCVSHHSIAAIDGRLIFMSEDGIYAFDGSRVRRITDRAGHNRLGKFLRTINKNAVSRCVSVHWRTRNCYLLAVPINDSQDNNHVICWNYVLDTLDIWDGWLIKQWFTYEDASDIAQIGFIDYEGNLYGVGFGDTDHGAAINAYVTTRRFGYRDNQRKCARSLEITGRQDATNSLSVELISDDDTNTTRTATLSFSDINDYGGSERRTKTLRIREQMDHMQVKLSQSTKYAKLHVQAIDVGYFVIGER